MTRITTSGCLILFCVVFVDTNPVSAQMLVLSVTNPDNGHTYQLWEEEPEISWSDANAFANGLGDGFHLATITTESENSWVFDTFLPHTSNWNPSGSYHGPWLGGFQSNPGVDEPAGGWGWVTGEPWEYTNWYPGEPNNSNGGEDFLHFNGLSDTSNPSTWNDLRNVNEVIGFIVESESYTGGSSIPEPSASCLVIGIFCFYIAIRSKGTICWK